MSNTPIDTSYSAAPVFFTPAASNAIKQPAATTSYTASAQTGTSGGDTQAKHEEAIQKLSAASQYPLGDKKFSIFKDATGQYITRYVSLRDGSVTYVPSPVLLKQANAENIRQLALDA